MFHRNRGFCYTRDSMGVTRHFLGWKRSLCDTVPAYLLAGAGAAYDDLRDTRLVVPTRQSSWRLRAALPVAAHARGRVLLGPEIVTPPVLLEPEAGPGTATGLQSLLAWVAVLTAIPPGACPAFLGARRDRPADCAWALPVARRLQELRRELADGGLTLEQVAAREAVIEERERWRELAELERRHTRQLAGWQLRDPLAVKLAWAAGAPVPADVRRVILAALPDPPELLLTLLARWSEAGVAVEVLVAAPPGEAAAFDAWGRPLPAAWAARPLAVRDADLWLEATPEEQAARIAQAVAAALRDAPPDSTGDGAKAPGTPQLALGVPDKEVIAPLQRELAALGLPAFDPRNRPFGDSPLYRLLQALLDLRAHDSYDAVAALLRHPDVLSAVGDGAGVLRALDAFQAEHLPVTLADMTRRGDAHAARPPAEALDRLRRWRLRLNEGGLAGGLRDVLQEIYQQRLLRADNPEDAAFQQDVAAFDAVLRELEGAGAAAPADDAAAAVLLARLREGQIRPERRNEPFELEGWLELAWNPAPLLFVAGMNEGYVPDGQVGDLFLPDTLRHQLGLRDDALRVARDAYVLTALLAQRRAGGRVILLVGKTSSAGDPLRPSRLLFRCPDDQLVSRARLLFREPPATRTASAYQISFKLDPARLPPGACSDKRARELSPTLFRAYLACPLRFYLHEVLGMEPIDDRAREPDARAFGNLVHDTVNAMADEGAALWGCGDPGRLGQWLEAHFREGVRRRYGARPWLGVELALDSAVRRLRAFAANQVRWHQEGWEIVQHEQARTCLLGGLTIKGRIDRIDRQATTGRIAVLDYKTSDRARTPAEVHLGSPREPEPLPEARAPDTVATKKRWTDLQLPLYRELVRGELGPGVLTGYILLPGALGASAFSLWEDYSDALHASALACAQAVIARLREGIFWPPGSLAGGYQDDLAGLLLDDPAATMEPPPAPWRAAP